MNEPRSKKFTTKAETIDKGKDFEHYNVANIILNLLTNQEVKNFWLASNCKTFGLFDDIVLEVISINNDKRTYAIQLKNFNKTKPLTMEKLVTDVGKMGITKYYKSYENEEELKKCTMILLTNAKMDSKREINLTFFSSTIKNVSTECDPLINTVSKKTFCVQFNFDKEKESQSHENFLKNFYLYVNQATPEDLKTTVLNKFKQMFRCGDDVSYKYLHFIIDWCKKEKKYMLDMAWMKKVIAVRLLSPFIVPHSFQNKSLSVFKRAVEEFNVTLISEELGNEVSNIWEDSEIDISDARKTKAKFGLQTSEQHLKETSQLNNTEKTQLWWLMEKCPLVVREDPAVFEAINLYPEGKYIVLTKTTKMVDLKTPVLQNLSDLKKNKQLYTKLIKEARCSLHGTEITLEKLLEHHEELSSKITTSELFKMLQEELFPIGSAEDLPKPYICRNLSTTIIDRNFLTHVKKSDQKTVIVLSGYNNCDEVKKLLANIELIKVKEFLKSPSKPKSDVVFFVADDCSRDDFDKICTIMKTMKNCYHFRVTKDENLEWVKSRGNMAELEAFRLENGCIEEKVLFESSPGHNINIICANPGIGKSTLTKNLKKELSLKYWTVIVHPTDISAYFREHNSLSFDEYIESKIFCESSEFDKSVMETFKSKKLMAYIWDGLDEISDENLIKVLKIILNLSSLNILQWLTSRGHLRDRLEKKFNVFSRTILQFDEEQQEKYINERLGNKEDNASIVKAIRDNIKMIRFNEVLGIPLQIYMLTELFCQDRDKYSSLLTHTFSLTDLYTHFVNEKFHHYYKEKAKIQEPNDCLKKILEAYKKSYIKKYEKAALKTLNEDITDDDCTTFLTSVKEDKDPFGLITMVSDNLTPEFLHNSYGEFFVASYFYNNHQKLPNLKRVLFKNRYTNIRFLFDLLMAKDSPVHIAVLYRNVSVLREHLGEDERDKAGRNPLHLACTWGQMYPLLPAKLADDNETHQIDDTLENVDNEDDDYKKIIDELLEKYDCNERDRLFGMTAGEYADTALCLYPLLQIILKTKTDLDVFFNFKNIATVLYYAVIFDWDYVIDMIPDVPFIKAGKRNLTLLHLCAEFGSENCLTKLLQTKNNSLINTADMFDVLPLTIACKKGKSSIVQLLIDSGADLGENLFTLVQSACKGGFEKTVEILLQHGRDAKLDHNSVIAMQNACLNGYEKIVRLLVDFGIKVNINTRYGTPLYIACHYDHKELVKTLIDQPTIKVNQGNKHDFTSLHIACQKNHVEIVKILLTHKDINVNVRDKKGLSPLHIVAKNGNKEEIARMLLDAEADKNCCCQDGCTPLYLACQNGHLDVVKLLLEYHVDVNIANNKKILPQQIAEINGFKEIVELVSNSVQNLLSST